MEHVYEGKTKTIFKLQDGNFLLKFKDDVTGENGVFDPGSNAVGLSISGMGLNGIKMSVYFFEKIEQAGVPTHYVSADLENATMVVKPAETFGSGLEFICRFRADGSFLKRYGKYIQKGDELDAFFEVTLKDDERQDPPINEEALVALKLLTKDEYADVVDYTKKISRLIKEDMLQKGIELYDIKLEFGKINGKIALIDEVSAGNMRCYKNGSIIDPVALAKLTLA